MKRERARQLLVEMLEALQRQADDPVVALVDRVEVFGSYSRGASEPGDVDVNIDYDIAAAFRMFGLDGSLSGKPTTAIKQKLIGFRRSVNVEFESSLEMVVPGAQPIVIWQRGDDLATALDRLDAIAVDPQAGPAPRSHMLPAFEGLDKWVPVFLRQCMITAVEAGAVSVTQVQIEDAQIHDEEVGWMAFRV